MARTEYETHEHDVIVIAAFARGIIHLVRTKSGKPRSVPINQVVRDQLFSLRQSSEWVFKSDKREKHLVEIKRAFRTACREAEIEDLHFHDLRHTAATRWAEAGAHTFDHCRVVRTC